MNMTGTWTGHCWYASIREFVLENELNMTLDEQAAGRVSGVVTETCRVIKVTGEVQTQTTEFHVAGQVDPQTGILQLAGRNNAPHTGAMLRCVLTLQSEGENKLAGTFADPDEQEDVQQAEFCRA